MKALTGTYNVDLRVRLDPGAQVISLDVSKELAVGTFKQIRNLSVRRLPHGFP